ncbi:MAG: DUF3558 domain-containing protein, partial [Haloechinothrix sp.]
MVGLAAVSFLAGCSSETGGELGSSGEPPADSGLPHSGAPKVENPIDTAAFEADPCSAITEQQLAEERVNIDEVKPEPDNQVGPSCTWYSTFEWGQFSGAVLTANSDGLSTQYAQYQAGEWAYFEELSVAGYPAVVNSLTDNRKNGDCTLNVGVRDDLTYILTLSLGTENPYRTKPCELAE